MNVSILLILSIFAIVTPGRSYSDKSMNDATNRVTTMKMDENKGLIQKKSKLTPKPVKSTKKRDNESQSILCSSDDGAAIASTKRDVDFLNAIKEKRKARYMV